MIITHSNVTEQLVSYLKENIVSGVWKVGEKIPSENQLTEILGVNRTSVRTVVQQMVGLGILGSRYGKGTYAIDNQVDGMSANKGKVTAQDYKDSQKVLEFRGTVEIEACYLVTRYATDEFTNEFQRCPDTMASNKVNKENSITADTAFYELICRESRDPLLKKSMSKVFEEACKDQGRTYELFGSKDGIYYHTLILNAIRSGDAKRARERIYEYLQAAIDKLNEPEQLREWAFCIKNNLFM